METEQAPRDVLRIAVTGSSGLVGRRLTPYLESRGHRVVRVVREKVTGTFCLKGPLDASHKRCLSPFPGLEGVDAVVHLAGENIFGRWTASKKERILQSRRQGTELISRTIARLDHRPHVLVSASAVGYYGDSGERPVDESDGPGKGFLAEVCQAWEEATRPAAEADIRTVRLRIGLVLSADGGALKMMLTPFRLGLGGRIGSGGQYMSWIHVDDLVRAIEQAILDDALTGPVNAVAPNPVTNRQFTKTLGGLLRRPTVFAVPSFAAKLAFGEMAEETLLSGQRVEPKKLQERGFQFEYPELEDALRREIG